MEGAHAWKVRRGVRKAMEGHGRGVESSLTWNLMMTCRWSLSHGPGVGSLRCSQCSGRVALAEEGGK